MVVTSDGVCRHCNHNTSPNARYVGFSQIHLAADRHLHRSSVSSKSLRNRINGVGESLDTSYIMDDLIRKKIQLISLNWKQPL